MTTSISEHGPEFSRIVFGVMKWGVWGHQLGPQGMLRLIEESADYGITTFDHADIYGNYTTEAEFGEALKLKPGLRDNIQLVTKCGIKMKVAQRPHHRIKSYDTSPEHIRASVDRSLRNLQTDYIDLLLLHRPSPLMDADLIAGAFEHLQKAGKVRHFGVSNFTPRQFDLLNSRFPLVTNQVEASLLHLPPFTDGTLDQCQEYRIKPMAWSPLGGGTIFSEQPDARAQRILATAETIIARREQNIGIDQLLLAWLMRHPSGILPVVGTARIERLKAAADAVHIMMSQEEWFELWEASTGTEVA
ncbi:MAG: aldo/keto reductase [Phaeodactylibacter sp.]|uniref:aldo/keto reductase n=1 Tax=Phaeodactylibacter sp. TaxID=1940289 RepID=UPI0032ED9D3D